MSDRGNEEINTLDRIAIAATLQWGLNNSARMTSRVKETISCLKDRFGKEKIKEFAGYYTCTNLSGISGLRVVIKNLQKGSNSL